MKMRNVALKAFLMFILFAVYFVSILSSLYKSDDAVYHYFK